MKCLAAKDSWCESISPFHREASFSHLRRVCRCNACKLCPHVVNDVEIAVRTIVISQANIGTHRLRVRSIELNQACKRQEPSEGITFGHKQSPGQPSGLAIMFAQANSFAFNKVRLPCNHPD